MGPARTTKASQAAESSSAHPGQPRSYSKAKSKGREPISSSIPGVQRLKSSIRQARRLLSKDNLAADVRVETERRLKALESDLTRASSAKKERTLAVRYHKIKFFERQKVTRRLNQTKKLLSEEAQSPVPSSSKRKLEDALMELRVDLNYVNHYPKTKKYISLFPPEVRHQDSSTSSSRRTQTASEQTKTDADRQEVRSWIRERMLKGDLSANPEMVEQTKKGKGSKKNVTASGGWNGRGEVGKIIPSLDDKREAGVVDDDDFFGDDNEPDGLDESGSEDEEA